MARQKKTSFQSSSFNQYSQYAQEIFNNELSLNSNLAKGKSQYQKYTQQLEQIISQSHQKMQALDQKFYQQKEKDRQADLQKSLQYAQQQAQFSYEQSQVKINYLQKQLSEQSNIKEQQYLQEQIQLEKIQQKEKQEQAKNQEAKIKQQQEQLEQDKEHEKRKMELQYESSVTQVQLQNEKAASVAKSKRQAAIEDKVKTELDLSLQLAQAIIQAIGLDPLAMLKVAAITTEMAAVGSQPLPSIPSPEPLPSPASFGLAEGGIIQPTPGGYHFMGKTGASHNLNIGESYYPEAVIPLEKSRLEQLGLAHSSGTTNYVAHMHLNAHTQESLSWTQLQYLLNKNILEVFDMLENEKQRRQSQ